MDALRQNLSAYSFTDGQTRDAMAEVYDKTGYIMDPHGAVGYLGLKKYMQNKKGLQGVFLETAHPVKFLEVVEPTVKKRITYPEQIRAIMDRKKEATCIRSYEEMKSYLLKDFQE